MEYFIAPLKAFLSTSKQRVPEARTENVVNKIRREVSVI